MKMRIHQSLVGLSLLVVIPGALLALLLLLGAIASGIEEGFRETDAIAIPLLILPAFYGWWGVRLFLRLNGLFSNRFRKGLLLYHCLNFCYCGMWLVTTHDGGDGGSFQIFTIQAQIIGFSLLAVPILTALFLRPSLEPDLSKAEQGGGGDSSPLRASP